MKKILIKIIEWYQKHISVWFQSQNIRCKFYPTCSEYTKQAIEKYGILKGIALGIAINTKIGKAVVRNKIKRLFRESYYFFEESLIEGQEIVFLWKKKQSVENANFSNIKADMQQIFDKAKVINK